MTGLEVDRLSVTYPGAAAPAVADLSLSAAAGELVAVLGPSGCGKSTLLRSIAGLVTPDRGSVTLDGRPLLPLPPERRGVVMMQQAPLLFPFMSVAQNVGFGLRVRGRTDGPATREVEAMLEAVGLAGLGPRRPADLSGGQAQRVALARALVVRPGVLLLDEPLSNLDAPLRADMRGLIRDLQQRLGITALMVTHDAEEAVAVADRMALMLDGRLRQVGLPEDFYRRPEDAQVAAFFGAVNLVRGVAKAGRFDCALGALALPAGIADGPGVLTFRPEAVRLGSGPNGVSARLVGRQFLGTRTRLVLAVGETLIEAVCAPDDAPAAGPGDGVAIHLPPAVLWRLPPVG